jgi:hypothetical protein
MHLDELAGIRRKSHWRNNQSMRIEGRAIELYAEPCTVRNIDKPDEELLLLYERDAEFPTWALSLDRQSDPLMRLRH